MNFNRIIIFAICTVMILSVFSSCTNNKNSSPASHSDSLSNDQYKDTAITIDTIPLVDPQPADKEEAEEKAEEKAETEEKDTEGSKEEEETEENEMDSEKDKKNPEITEKDGITYVNGILIANKSYSLPKTYSPGIDTTANNALQQMFSAASNAGISLYVVSGFRSYDTQYNTYYGYVSRSGQADADRYSARPGHSEHQTGLAFDLNSLEQTFGNTKEGKWLKANAHKYGFIIRYPEGKESVTGYMYEPWHVRYLGTDIATDVFESGLCLEEYLGITSVYNN